MCLIRCRSGSPSEAELAEIHCVAGALRVRGEAIFRGTSPNCFSQGSRLGVFDTLPEWQPQ